MKKLIPVILAFFSLQVFAQQNRPNVPYGIDKHPSQSADVILKAKATGPVNYFLSNSTKIGTSTKQGNSIETLIGHSANPFTSVGDVRSAINYNPDLNLITYLYRQDPAEYGNVGNSGWMRYSMSQDGGNTWTENNGLLWDNIGSTASNGRYPQGFIYNPAGNTIADSAYQVWLGPTLTATNGASWGGIGYGSVKIGNAGATSTDQGEFVTGPNTTKYYIPDGGTFANDKFWAVEFVQDVSTGSVVFLDSLAIYEGSVQNGSINLTRNKMYFPVDMDNAPYSAQIAFSPDGQTGYIVCLGRLDSAAYPKRAANLIYMKSTDAGLTWSAPSEVYFADDTLITNNIGDSAATGNIASAQFQVDLVVDTFGNPHTLFNIEWRPDNEYGFVFVGLPSTIWHVHSPDGGTNWDFNRVFTTQLRYGGIGDGANDVYQENRPQLSRDENGRYVMMSYFDTDTTLLINQTPCTGFSSGYCGNSDRFINTSGYNVVKDYYAPVIAWDFFLQGSYTSNFENISELAPFDGSVITIPYEYMKIADKTNYVSPVDHYYENGVSYTKEELGDTTTVGFSQSLIENEGFKVFPNPASSKVNVMIKEYQPNEEISVYNSLGQLVLHSNQFIETERGAVFKLNISTLNQGIYLIKSGSSTKSTRFVKE